MESGYDGKRQKPLTQQQGVRVIQPNHAELWQGNHGQRQQIDKSPHHPQPEGETSSGAN